MLSGVLAAALLLAIEIQSADHSNPLPVQAAKQAQDQAVEIKDSIEVTVTGTLQTGIFAIGGETTGTTITANNVTWELLLGESVEMKRTAEQLNGKKAIVKGLLERRAGTEIKERWIVTVTELRDAAKARDGDREE